MKFSSRKISILGIYLLFIFGCSSSDLDELKLDSNTFISLNGRPLNLEIMGVPRITMLNDYIICINENGENIFSIIDPIKEEVINEFGKLDQLPEEFSFPIFTADYVPKVNNKLFIHDLDKNEYFEYNLNGIDLELKKNEKIPFPIGYYPNFLVLKTDSLTIYFPEYGGILVFFDNKTNQFHSVDYFPIPETEIGEKNKWMAYQANLAINLEKELIAYNPLLFGELDFFDFEGNLVKRSLYDLSNHFSTEFKSDNLTKTELKRFAIDIQATSKSIYLLIEGNTFEMIRNKKSIQNSTILEFDWEGNFKNGFLLDRPILSIAFNEKENKIFGVSLVKENEVIIEYSLKPQNK